MTEVERRQKTFTIAAELVAQWLKHNAWRANIPGDTTIRDAKFDPTHNTVTFLLESQEFPTVPPACSPESELFVDMEEAIEEAEE